MTGARWRGLIGSAVLVLGSLPFVTSGGAPAIAAPAPRTSDGPTRAVGFYVPSGSDITGLPVPDATLAGLTHAITYVDMSGTSCAPTATELARFDQLHAYQVKHPGLRVLLSLGLGSSAFSAVAASPTQSAEVAASCTALVVARGFDGFDVDWEFPVGAADKANLTRFMAALRKGLDTAGRPMDLTIDTVMAWLPDQRPAYDFPALSKIVSWFNVMDYDMNIPEIGGHKTSFNTPLSVPTGAQDLFAKFPNIHYSLDLYRSVGVPDNQYVMGMAFYAYLFRGVHNANNGLWQTFDPTLPGSGQEFCYDNTVTDMLKTVKPIWNDGAASPWLFDPATSTAISYDDPRSLHAKAAFERSQHLGGIMIWHLTCDDTKGTLFAAIHQALTEPVPPPPTTTTTTMVARTTAATTSTISGAHSTAQPATPVVAQPTFTG